MIIIIIIVTIILIIIIINNTNNSNNSHNNTNDSNTHDINSTQNTRRNNHCRLRIRKTGVYTWLISSWARFLVGLVSDGLIQNYLPSR